MVKWLQSPAATLDNKVTLFLTKDTKQHNTIKKLLLCHLYDNCF